MIEAEIDLAGTLALVTIPDDARWVYLFAHGAGAGMRHPFMAKMASALAAQKVATVRWELPYRAQKKKRPDRADVAEDAVRSMWSALRGDTRIVAGERVVAGEGVVVGDGGIVAGERVVAGEGMVAAAIRARLASLPLFAGGKSFGGRMTSRADAWTLGGLPGLAGLVFLGFPLYGAGQEPSTTRADHLARVKVPLLFVQGSRDELADLAWLRPVVDKLGARLHVIDGADHGFSNRNAYAEIAVTIAAWMESVTR
jgi:predicted alpha/beta-hydrolase family hydrolase